MISDSGTDFMDEEERDTESYNGLDSNSPPALGSKPSGFCGSLFQSVSSKSNVSSDENNENDSNKNHTQMDFGFSPIYQLTRSDSYRAEDFADVYENSNNDENNNCDSGTKHVHSPGPIGSETPAKKRREEKRNSNTNSNNEHGGSEFTGLGLLNLGPKENLTITNGSGERVQSRFHNDFILLSFLGNGTFGTVMRVKHKVSHVEYAVKKSKRPFTSSKSDRQVMTQEVGTMAELMAASDVSDKSDEEMSHIVRYYGGWIEDEHVFLQMELCDETVEKILENQSLQFNIFEIYNIIRDVLKGLKFVHSRGFVHLDIKPGNILKKGQHYKLSDFGMAIHINNGDATSSGSSSGSAALAGTVEEGDSRYLARELLDWNPGENNLTKCDIYSVGVTAYEMVTRKIPPMEGEEWQMLRNDSWFSHFVTDYSDTPSELLNILKETLNSNPSLRPTAEHCLQKHLCLMTDSEKQIVKQSRQVKALNELLMDSLPKTKLRRNHSVA